MLRTITAIEYVTPVREDGSLPAIIEGYDDGTYVLKFRGASRGPKALISDQQIAMDLHFGGVARHRAASWFSGGLLR